MFFVSAERVFAGEVALTNGDVLKGELLSIQQDHLVWQSVSFESLKIPKNKVEKLVSAVPLKLPARKGPCYWSGMNRGRVTFQCAAGGEVLASLLSIKEAVLYQDHKKTTFEQRGKLTATGQRESGVRQKQDWVVDANVFLRHTDFRHNLLANYRGESINKSELRQRYELSYQFDWFFAPKTFWSSKASALRDELRFIDRRYSLSSGIGYQFWENRRSSLSIELGPQYLEEAIVQNVANQNVLIEDDYASWRIASAFNLRLPRDTRFSSRIEIVRSMSDGEDWDAKTSSGLSLPIAGGITAELIFDFDYDNTPVDQRSPRDSRLRLGLGYRW